MREIKVASRYAKSLFDLSSEYNQLDRVLADMELVKKTCHQVRPFALLLKSPIIKTDKKESIIKDIFGKTLNELSLSFIHIILTKRREYLLESIATQFVKLYKKFNHIYTAVVTSVIPLDETARQKIKKSVALALNGTVEIIEKEDPGLIGGFILRIDDLEYNASIRKQLKDLRKNFNNNPYIKDL